MRAVIPREQLQEDMLHAQATYLLDICLLRNRLHLYNREKGATRVPAAEIEEILTRRAAGESISSIARGMKWTTSTVGRVLRLYAHNSLLFSDAVRRGDEEGSEEETLRSD